MAENKVRYGLSNVHVVKIIRDEEDNITYDIPKRLPGAVSISMDAEGSQDPFFADNMAYYIVSTNNGYTGTFEVAVIPDWYLLEHLGYVEDDNGNLVEDASIQPVEHGLMFQFEGDIKATKHFIYSFKPGRPSLEGETTEDSTEPQTEEMDFTAPPIAVDGRRIVKTKTTTKTSQAIYDGWYTTAPKLPTFNESSESTFGL